MHSARPARTLPDNNAVTEPPPLATSFANWGAMDAQVSAAAAANDSPLAVRLRHAEQCRDPTQCGQAEGHVLRFFLTDGRRPNLTTRFRAPCGQDLVAELCHAAGTGGETASECVKRLAPLEEGWRRAFQVEQVHAQGMTQLGRDGRQDSTAATIPRDSTVLVNHGSEPQNRRPLILALVEDCRSVVNVNFCEPFWNAYEQLLPVQKAWASRSDFAVRLLVKLVRVFQQDGQGAIIVDEEGVAPALSHFAYQVASRRAAGASEGRGQSLAAAADGADDRPPSASAGRRQRAASIRVRRSRHRRTDSSDSDGQDGSDNASLEDVPAASSLTALDTVLRPSLPRSITSTGSSAPTTYGLAAPCHANIGVPAAALPNQHSLHLHQQHFAWLQPAAASALVQASSWRAAPFEPLPPHHWQAAAVPADSVGSAGLQQTPCQGQGLGCPSIKRGREQSQMLLTAASLELLNRPQQRPLLPSCLQHQVYQQAGGVVNAPGCHALQSTPIVSAFAAAPAAAAEEEEAPVEPLCLGLPGRLTSLRFMDSAEMGELLSVDSGPDGWCLVQQKPAPEAGQHAEAGHYAEAGQQHVALPEAAWAAAAAGAAAGAAAADCGAAAEQHYVEVDGAAALAALPMLSSCHQQDLDSQHYVAGDLDLLASLGLMPSLDLNDVLHP